MFLLYHAYVYLEFLILACTIYILAPPLLVPTCGSLHLAVNTRDWTFTSKISAMLGTLEKMTLWNLPTEPFFLYAFYFRYPFVTISTISPVGMENSTIPIYPGATSYLSNTRVSFPFSLT